MSKSVYFYLDGVFMCDLLEYALDHNITLERAKSIKRYEWMGHKVEFIVE